MNIESVRFLIVCIALAAGGSARADDDTRFGPGGTAADDPGTAQQSKPIPHLSAAIGFRVGYGQRAPLAEPPAARARESTEEAWDAACTELVASVRSPSAAAVGRVLAAPEDPPPGRSCLTGKRAELYVDFFAEDDYQLGVGHDPRTGAVSTALKLRYADAAPRWTRASTTSRYRNSANTNPSRAAIARSLSGA